MFGFMKKLSDKDKEEKERKRKEKLEKEQRRVNNGLTAEELIRLEEAKQSLQLKKNVVPSPLYTVKVSQMEIASTGDSSNKNTQLVPNISSKSAKGPPPIIQPKPTRRGFLVEKIGLNSSTCKESLTSPKIDAISQNKNLAGTGIISTNRKDIKNIISSFDKETDQKKTLNSSVRRSQPIIPERKNVCLTSNKSIETKTCFDSIPEDSTNKLYKKLINRMPPLMPPFESEHRKIELNRLQSGDFGFSLRKGMTVTRKRKPEESDVWEPVIFAEARSKNIEVGFLPGDRIVEIAGCNVESSNRETIIDILKRSGNHVYVVVQTVPELNELNSKLRTSSRKRKDKYQNIKARPEDRLASDQASLSSNLVWLVHKGGYTLGKLVGSSDDGSVKIELEPGQIMEASEEDIEKVNPPHLDRVEDLTVLRYVNESSLLHTLRQRYASNLIHTYAGFSLLVINSMHPLSLYSDKIIQSFKRNSLHDVPPHIYSVAHSAFKLMMSSRHDQSIILLGRCGSGKTFHALNIANYFVNAYGSVHSILTCDKLSAITTLLESFASCKTTSGFNSTKFTQVFSLDFDQNGQIVSASVQVMMLEKTRMFRKVSEETTVNIIQHFIYGIDSNLRKELHLESLDSNHPYYNSSPTSDESSKATQNWNKDLNSFKQLNITDGEVKAFCLVLAAIYHLGSAGASKGANNRYQFKNASSAQHAARLLGTTVDELTRTIFCGSILSQSGTTLSPGLRIANNRENILSSYSGSDLVECFIAGLYAELFNALVALINRSLASNYRTTASILIVDAPGFRDPPATGGARLDDLFHNYVQERLQNLFYETVFNSARDLYSQEGVDIDFDFPEPYSSVLVQLIDNPPQNLTRSPECGGQLSSNRGLLWILDEQSLLPSTTDESFLDCLFIECSHFQVKGPLMVPGSLANRFVLNHLNGSSSVEYDVSGWLKSAREGALGRVVGTFLVDSKRPEISDMFSQTCKTVGGTVVSGSIVGVVDAPSSLRRASSMKRTFTSGAAAVKKRSLCLQIKFQSDTLVDMLKRTRISFIHCLSPHNTSNHPDVVNTPFIRTQLNSALILPSVRLHKQGFPEHISFQEFLHKYRILSPLGTSTDANKNVIEEMLQNLEIDRSLYRMGTSKVFFHSGVLGQLETLREENVSNWLIKLQALCRMHLARKNLQKLKLQHMAVACVQKNIRKLMAVRSWPWWKLYTRIKPVLNIHKTEEELRDMQLEVDQLKQRLEKAEREKQEYKQAFERLEVTMTELALELQDEHNTAVQASEMLENETAQRLTIEKELKELQNKYNNLQGENRGVEIELMNLKMLSNSVESDTEEELGDSVYKERYERMKKATEFTKKKMEMKFEEKNDELESSKKSLEKKIAELLLETERQENALRDAKKKTQKQGQEMADIKLHLEEQVARNAELEKKQRKFDNEIAKVSDILKGEKSLREKLLKEKDDLVSQKYAIDQEYKNMKMDFEMQSQKLQKVELDMIDLVSSGKDDKDALKIRQSKNELENKVKDLEEELDEQAGTIQQLEQAKLRLEMSLEKLRQQHSKEVEEKENDLEELKRNFQKKFRTLEMQLEEEYEEKQKCLKEKREFERKLQTVSEEKPAKDKDVEMLLRRDLKRSKALLQDAQLMLQKYKEGAGNRQTLKQLRDQLEDAEFAKASALKAKKSMELELDDLQQQLDDMTKLRNEGEEKFMSVNKEKHELLSRIEENDEEISELMKKYKAAVQQHSLDLIKFEEQSHQIESLQQEKETLKEEMAKLQSRTDYFETSTVDRETITRLEAKIRDFEAKLDFEQANRRRSEVQLGRLRDQLEAETDTKQSLKSEELRTQEQMRQLQRKLKESEDDFREVQLKESEATKRKLELERKMEDLQIEYEQTQSDLHLAFKRIADLQAVIEDDIETNNDSDDLESDTDGDEDDSEDFK